MIVKYFKILIYLFICAFIVLAALPADANAADRKIAVAAESDKSGASISPITARAPFILIFDENEKLIEVHKNPILRNRQAGPALAKWLSGKGVDVLIGAEIGQNLRQSLDQYQITWIEASGSAADAIKHTLK